MACPSGCLNGGGQLKASGPQGPKALLAEVQVLYGGRLPCPHLCAWRLRVTAALLGLARAAVSELLPACAQAASARGSRGHTRSCWRLTGG